ncbi:family 20 glycosylhydrolase [Spirosoma terrae]|uniref:beta-N-acetylhexosaminidase n=2 Tax=Spirosoma terrae TaxID=1968276 RepID=A0A6L9LGW0_9BACT|nr:family 20 glycosylhydrolase [Spirosoma terrae]
MKRYALLLFFSFLLFSACTGFGQLNLIPYPQQVNAQPGAYRFAGQSITYYCSDPKVFANELRYLNKNLLENSSLKEATASQATLQLLKNEQLANTAYRLKINKNGVRLEAKTGEGMFSGLQTLRQLIEFSGSDNALPYVTIQDAPTYEWRGVELDVARHFFSKNYLFKFIDLLALYKFNTLHLHLTDDQGWRLEIKKYPKLTEEGAWRLFNNQDSACIAKSKENPDFALPAEHLRTKNGQQEYGGFYTQADMRDIIAYAAERHIDVVPEIDMPGHMMMATKAYPELLDGSSAGWGKQFSVPLCVCKEEVYQFVEGVLGEVIDLFPSRFVHIGADEVEKSSWEKSALCQELMKREKLSDVHDLQRYFVNRVNTFIRQKGKITIGWDEILEGKVDTTMRVMYWRGWVKDAPLKAVTRHHDLVMTPTNPLYFDYLPNKSTLASTYQLQVVPSDIPADLAHYVKGAQANVWTEMIPSAARLEFMILPRLSALAERVWTNKSLFDTYQQRLIHHFALWDKMALRYRLPDLSGFADQQVLVDGRATLRVQNPLPTARVHYTVDGTLPTQASPVFTSALPITKPGHVRFAAIARNGAKSELYTVTFTESGWKKAVNVPDAKPGLDAAFYAGTFRNTKAMSGNVVRRQVLSNVQLSDTLKWPSFGAKINGYIKVPKKARYNFYFTCDDGGVLRIADQLVVDNDGQHAPVEKSGQIALEAGLHPFAVDFIEAGGGFTLKLAYSEDGGEVKPVPDSWFFH